jgi:hypothetical protein
MPTKILGFIFSGAHTASPDTPVCSAEVKKKMIYNRILPSCHITRCVHFCVCAFGNNAIKRESRRKFTCALCLLRALIISACGALSPTLIKIPSAGVYSNSLGAVYSINYFAREELFLIFSSQSWHIIRRTASAW